MLLFYFSILISQSAELLMRVCSSPAEDISSSMLVTGDHPLTITLDNRHEKPIYVQARLQFSGKSRNTIINNLPTSETYATFDYQ